MTSWSAERGDPSDDAFLAAEAERRDSDAEVGERVAVELAAAHWADLVVASKGAMVGLDCQNGQRVVGPIEQSGQGWCLVGQDGRSQLVPFGQVVAATGLQRAARGRTRRAGIGWVFRQWAQMRSEVTVELVDRTTRRGRVTEVLADALTVRGDEEEGAGSLIPFAAVCRVVGDSLEE